MQLSENVSLEVKKTGDVPHISFPSGELESKRTAPSSVSALEQWGDSISKGHQKSLRIHCHFSALSFPERARKTVMGPLIYGYSLCVSPAGATAAALQNTIARERHKEKGSQESTSPSFLPLLSRGRFVFCFCGTACAGCCCLAQAKPKEQGQTGVYIGLLTKTVCRFHSCIQGV